MKWEDRDKTENWGTSFVCQPNKMELILEQEVEEKRKKIRQLETVGKGCVMCTILSPSWDPFFSGDVSFLCEVLLLFAA